MRRATAVSMLAAAPWIGVFNLSITGGKVDVSWTMHHADAGACDVSANGSGSESGPLGAGGLVPVTLTGVGTNAFLVPATGLHTTATLDREGSITYGADDGDDTDGCPSGDGSQPPEPDCGTQVVPLTFTFTPGASPGLSGDSIDSPWKNCPVSGLTPPAVPDNLSAPVLVSGTGPQGAPLLPFQLIGTDVQADSDTDATSKLEVDMQLARVAIIEALDVPDSYKTAPVDGHGDTKVPVSCPAGAACKGTIGIAAGGFGSGRAATAPPAWPKPLQQAEPLLGSARFSLKSGKRARVTLRLAHGSTQVIHALAGQKLDVIVRQSAKGRAKPIAFAAGQVKLRPR